MQNTQQDKQIKKNKISSAPRNAITMAKCVLNIKWKFFAAFIKISTLIDKSTLYLKRDVLWKQTWQVMSLLSDVYAVNMASAFRGF